MIVEKIINSLLYGSSKTKSYLWTIIVFGVAALGCLAGAAIGGSLVLLIVGLAFGALGVVVFQSVSFREVVKEGEDIGKQRKESLEKGNLHGEKRKKGGKKTGEELLAEQGLAEVLKENEQKDQEENSEPEKKAVFKKYSEKEMKKLMLTYKVKKQHKKVIVDFSSKFRIRQCPAFMWKERNELFFLLLEENPRIVRIPLEKIKEIRYEKNAAAKPQSDYEEFKEPGLITRMFSEYLPQYHERNNQGQNERVKNLYIIYPDIRLTNHSARSAFDVLEVDFKVEDKVTMSSVYEDYFKMAYKAHILWLDQVISTNEYKEKIKVLLTSLSSENLSKGLFDQVLQQLTAHKLITEEYAKYYRELRK